MNIRCNVTSLTFKAKKDNFCSFLSILTIHWYNSTIKIMDSVSSKRWNAPLRATNMDEYGSFGTEYLGNFSAACPNLPSIWGLTWKQGEINFTVNKHMCRHPLGWEEVSLNIYGYFIKRFKMRRHQTGRRNFGKNFEEDTDLLFLSGFPVWAKL